MRGPELASSANHQSCPLRVHPLTPTLSPVPGEREQSSRALRCTFPPTGGEEAKTSVRSNDHHRGDPVRNHRLPGTTLSGTLMLHRSIFPAGRV